MAKHYSGPLSAEDMLSLALIGAGVDYAIYRRTGGTGKRMLCSVVVFGLCSHLLRLTR